MVTFEHAVPERLFADPNKPLNDPSQPQGVSAVKALAIAASQGQKIYTLNAQNQAYHVQIVAGLNIDAGAKQEISNALSAGKEVTVHQAEITVNGWTGSGYILLDPGTGAGAYKISGGANGGYLDTWANGLGTNVGLALAFTSLLALLGVASVFVIILAILTIFVALMNFMVIELQTAGCQGIGAMGQAFEVFSAILSFFGAGGVALGAWLSLLSGGAVSGVSGLSQCKGY